jgi:putative FmdB family regulatory protein
MSGESMPLYEYICADCGNEFEKMMRFDQSDEKPVCPSCDSADTHKQVSLFSSKSNLSFTGSSSSSGSCSGGRSGFT